MGEVEETVLDVFKARSSISCSSAASSGIDVRITLSGSIRSVNFRTSTGGQLCFPASSSGVAARIWAEVLLARFDIVSVDTAHCGEPR